MNAIYQVISALSDEELNYQLAEILDKPIIVKNGRVFEVVQVGEEGVSIVIDFCNNYEQIMPLAHKHSISLLHRLDPKDRPMTPMASLDSEVFAQSDNPCRAVAETLLLKLTRELLRKSA